MHLLLIAATPALRLSPLTPPASSLRLSSPMMAMDDKDAASAWAQGGGHPSGTETRLMSGIVVPPVADEASLPAAAPPQAIAGIRSEACQMDGGRSTGSEMRLTGGVVVPPLGNSLAASPTPSEEEGVTVPIPTVPAITETHLMGKDAASAYLKDGGHPSGTETRLMGGICTPAVPPTTEKKKKKPKKKKTIESTE